MLLLFYQGKARLTIIVSLAGWSNGKKMIN